MQLHDFDYDLPPELIAQEPLKDRAASRMMLLNRATGTIEDRQFSQLPSVLRPGDLVVFNNTRVFPARLLGRRHGERSQPIGKNNRASREYLTTEVELLLTRREVGNIWQGLVHPGRKVRVGEVLLFGDGALEGKVLGRGDYGLRRVQLRPGGNRPTAESCTSAGAANQASEAEVDTLIDRIGHVPLPPYIHRADEPRDREAYQTVYARVRGAVAAPTAGLHFTPQVLSELADRGIETAEITLHVGPGTFRPVQVENAKEHHMDAEMFDIGKEAADRVNRALSDTRRVIAVGTTCVRTLEHAARASDRGTAGRVQIEPGQGETSLFVYPGFEFRVVDALVTNFHLPRSTLLMLMSAFAGREFTLRAYQHAVERRYRFYSYGDCMLVV